ncbi:MAG TPA: metallophosphoesterase [Polyangiaceae bacterium]|jgi:hypothetical protein|nr:metallophosphoesterase [Polyangiaceae bacterium]
MLSGQRSPKALGFGLLWVLAWSVAWALLVMERVLELHEGLPRSALSLLGFVLIAGSASWAMRALPRSRLRYLPLVVLGVIALREGRRHVLRREYLASAPIRRGGPAQSLFRPVTTTDLAVSYYQLAAHPLTTKRLRIVALTDLHISPALPFEYFDHVRTVVAAQDPDLILLSGDFVSFPRNIELLARLFARPWPSRFGAFAVLGNHDFWTDETRVRETLSAGGVTLVENRCQHLPPDVGKVAICGTDAPWGPELTATLDRSELNVVLSHTPDNVYRLAEQGASLVFAGHTHGGQIRLPVIGSIVVPSRNGRMFDEGHFRVEGADLFVSAGVGADDPPLRLYCQPEIFVVDLSHE